MCNQLRILSSVLVLAVLATTGPLAFARGGGGGHGGGGHFGGGHPGGWRGGGVYLGGAYRPFYGGYSSYPPYAYYGQGGVPYYYCPDFNSYYPNVTNCPSNWVVQVLPQ